VLLLRNKDQEYYNPLASFATCLCCRQRSELRTCAKSVGASRSRCCPDWPRVHLSGPAYMPSCPEVRFPLNLRPTSRSQISTWSTYFV